MAERHDRQRRRSAAVLRVVLPRASSSVLMASPAPAEERHEDAEPRLAQPGVAHLVPARLHPLEQLLDLSDVAAHLSVGGNPLVVVERLPAVFAHAVEILALLRQIPKTRW